MPRAQGRTLRSASEQRPELQRHALDSRIHSEEFMNRISSILAMFAVLALFAFSTPAVAHEGHHMPGEKVVTKTITGEVVDMGCWLGHAARGEKHISCATKCLNQGIPMGLLTSNGTLYLVTL